MGFTRTSSPVCTTTVEQLGVEGNFCAFLTWTLDLDGQFRALTSVLAHYEKNPGCLFSRAA